MGSWAQIPREPLTPISKVMFSMDAPGGCGTMVVDDPVDSEPTVNQPVSTLPDAPQLELFD